MAYKYKLSEMSKTASPEAAAKELERKDGEGFQVGQVTYATDGQSKSTITNIDKETGAVSWKITQLPGFDKLYDEMDQLVDVAKRVYVKTKDDKKFREIYDEARKLRNKVRTHLRNEYPDEYKRMTRIGEGHHEEGEVDEASMSGAAGAYNTPYAFVRKKLKKGKKKKGVKMNKPSGLVNYMDYSVNEGVGASLGPGPKAGENGVADNAYVKQFKYKLVKKNKDGTYVQPPSTLPVRKLWGE